MKKKKWLSMLLAVVMVIAMIPMTVFAAGSDGATFTSGTIKYQIVSETEKTVEVARNSDTTYSGEIIVPETVEYDNETYTVIGLGNAAFYLQRQMTSVQIPKTVKYFGDNAFRECNNLTAITFPNGSALETIGTLAFCWDSKLTDFNLPSTVTYIGVGAFGGCSSLETLHIPAGLTSNLRAALSGYTEDEIKICYSQSAFPNAGNVTIDENNPVYSIYNGGLYTGTTLELQLDPSMTTVEVKDGTTYISEGAFFEMSNRNSRTDPFNSLWETIVLPDTVTAIGEAAFRGSTIKNINLPESITEIGPHAFLSCENLEKISIPEGITELPSRTVSANVSGVFQGCTSLQEVVLPSSLQSIDDRLFQGCTSLTSVVIPEGVQSIGDESFADCTSLTTVTIPDGVVSIGEEAFADCKNIELVVIPSSVTEVGDWAFAASLVDGATVIMQGTTPPSFGNDEIFVENTGDIIFIVPTGSEAAYAEVDELSSYMKDAEGNVVQNQDYSLTLPDTVSICPEKSVQLEMVYELPDGANLTFTSSNPAIATVDEQGNVTGVADGEATITASITLNGIVLVSDTCTVTVGHTTGTEWKSDETGHWKECADCGAKLDEAEHTFKWVTDKEATATEAGSKHEECEVCGYKKAAVEIPATGTTEDPSEPSEPSNPGETPSEPPTDTDKPSGDQTGDTTSPQTGDDSNIVLWIAVMLVAGTALTGTAVYSRKKRYSR